MLSFNVYDFFKDLKKRGQDAKKLDELLHHLDLQSNTIETLKTNNAAYKESNELNQGNIEIFKAKISEQQEQINKLNQDLIIAKQQVGAAKDKRDKFAEAEKVFMIYCVENDITSFNMGKLSKMDIQLNTIERMHAFHSLCNRNYIRQTTAITPNNPGGEFKFTTKGLAAALKLYNK